ncbi:MAG: DUF4040 domain-containing protein [Phycisphaerales bacterium]|nr:DUF4040 domain-containing protein [Phycisphaerales bacterium]
MTASTTIWLLLCVLAPTLLGLATLFLPRKAITVRTLLALAGPVLSMVILGQHLSSHGVAVAGEPVATPVISWIPLLNMNLSFLADGLGAFFGLLVSGIGILIVLYARGYFGPDEASLYRFYPTLGFFTTAMMGIVLSDYLLVTVLFWELTSISSFLLIGWDRYDKHAVKLAMQAFFTTGLGGMFLMGGVLMFGFATDIGHGGGGLWRWSEVLALGPGRISPSDPFIIASFALMLFGAATKSAQWPFHYWLPGAMAAPTPVSAYLHSATMVKAGVFLVARMFPVFAVLHLWSNILVPLGAFTMVLGAVVALNQHDLKRIFAYTTVSQLGLLMCVYGLGGMEAGGHPNIEWGITQIANHAFYKAPLFIIAGALGHYISRDITELNGAFRKQPWMVLTMLLGGYALAAGPGTVSFPAKEFFLHAIHESAESIGPWWMLLMAMAAVTAMCNVAIFVRLLTTLMGWPGGMKPAASHGHDDGHGHGHGEHEHGPWAQMIWIPALALVSLQYVGGLAPGLWSQWFAPLETNMHHFAEGVPSALHAFTHPGVPLYVSLIAIICGVSIGLSGLMRGAIVDIHDRIYPAMYWLSVTGGGRAFRLVQTGRFRNYLVFVLLAFLAAYVASMVLDPTMLDWPQVESPFEFFPGMLLGAIICTTAILMPIVQSRVVRVIILGSCGFSVVGMYLLYQAPDLALTQLMFEIISVILFVLVLRMLPDKGETDRASGRWWRFSLGTLTGVAIGWLTLVSAQSGAEPRLGAFFAQHSYSGTEMTDGRGGGGKNIVNVTLVDFRGFDTLGEITVLSIAALGVFSLFPRRKPLPTELEFDDQMARGVAL